MTTRSEYNKTDIPQKIVLVGNPNVGKSIIFNHLTGKYVEVSNFPGTTVEVFQGNYKQYHVFDTPGIFSVSNFNDEERVAKKYILDADLIIIVVDANRLERDLFLTFQLLDMGKKIIIILNIIDELEKNNISLNLEKLIKSFKVPVIPTIAPEGVGFIELENAIQDFTKISIPEGIKTQKVDHLNITKVEKVLILEGDPELSKQYNIDPIFERDEFFFERRRRVNEFVPKIIIPKSGKQKISSILGNISIHPVYGIPAGLLILYLTYLFIGVFVAGTVVDFTKEKIGTRLFENNIKNYISQNAETKIVISRSNQQDEQNRTEYYFQNGTINEPQKYAEFRKNSTSPDSHIEHNFVDPLLTILFGEFGIFTMTISYIFFLLFPLVAGFYFMLSILEDSGYLPRIATLVDKLLSYIGLNGRAIIPIILGFGCVSMATITTRMLGSKRERTIATTILQLAIPCSAQLGVIATLLARAEIKVTVLYIIIIFIFLTLVGTILSRFIPGESSPLLIDLPNLRIPRASNIIRKTALRTFGFMKEASPWFFFGAILISVMQITGLLRGLIDILHPIVVHWLKLPPEAGIAFVMGLVRRDFGAAGLYDINLNSYQTLVSLITLTLFVPCITSLIIMFKERGSKEGIIIWIASITLAFFLGGLIAQIVT